MICPEHDTNFDICGGEVHNLSGHWVIEFKLRTNSFEITDLACVIERCLQQHGIAYPNISINTVPGD